MPDRSDSDRRPITERHARRSVAVVVPSSRHEKRKSESQRTLPLALTEALEKDPAYRVVSGDQRFWIEPVGGKAVQISGRLDEVRKDFFRANLDLWRQHGVLPNAKLIEMRWRHEVMQLLASDKRRMTIFSRPEGYWLNPFSGVLVTSVTRDDGKITARTVKAMALALATCPQARTGQLLSREALRERKKELGYRDPGEDETTTWERGGTDA